MSESVNNIPSPDPSDEEGDTLHISCLPEEVLVTILRFCTDSERPGSLCSAQFLRYVAKSHGVRFWKRTVPTDFVGFANAPQSVHDLLKTTFAAAALSAGSFRSPGLGALLVCKQWHRIVQTRSVVDTLAMVQPDGVPQSVETLFVCVRKYAAIDGLVALIRSRPALRSLIVCRQVSTTYTTVVPDSVAAMLQDWQIVASGAGLLSLRQAASASALHHLTLPGLHLLPQVPWTCSGPPLIETTYPRSQDPTPHIGGAVLGLPTTLRSLSLFSDAFLCDADAPALAQLTALHVAKTRALSDPAPAEQTQPQSIAMFLGRGTPRLQRLCLTASLQRRHVDDLGHPNIKQILHALAHLTALTQLVMPIEVFWTDPTSYRGESPMSHICALTALRDLRLAADYDLHADLTLKYYTKPFTLDVAPLSALQQLTRLQLNFTDVPTPPVLSLPLTPLAHLQQLQALEFRAEEREDDDLAPLSALQRLTALAFTSDDGQVGGGPRTAEGRWLAYLPATLRELRLRGLRNIDADAFCDALSKLLGLRVLTLSDVGPASTERGCSEEAPSFYARVLRTVPATLQHIELRSHSLEWKDSIEEPMHVASLKDLRYLELHSVDVSSLMLEDLPQLTAIECAKCPRLYHVTACPATTAALRCVRFLSVPLRDSALLSLGFVGVTSQSDHAPAPHKHSLVAKVGAAARAVTSLLSLHREPLDVANSVDGQEPADTADQVVDQNDPGTHAAASDFEHNPSSALESITIIRRYTGKLTSSLSAPIGACSLQPSPNLRRLELAYVHPDKQWLLSRALQCAMLRSLHTCSALTFLALSEPADALADDIARLAQTIGSLTRLETLCLYSWPNLGVYDAEAAIRGLTRLRTLKMTEVDKVARAEDAPRRLAACLSVAKKPALQEVQVVLGVGLPMAEGFGNGEFAAAVSGDRKRAIEVSVLGGNDGMSFFIQASDDNDYLDYDDNDYLDYDEGEWGLQL